MATYDLSQIKDGDLLGFSGQGALSDLINIGTWRMPRQGIAHIGICCTYRKQKYIFESTTTNGDKSCVLQGKPVNGVQAHLLEDILTRPGKVWHYPLTSELYPQEQKRMVLLLLSSLGRPYDMEGAGRSAGFVFRTIGMLLRDQDLSKFFCSELCALALTTVGRARIMNVSGQNPNSLVFRLSRKGVIRKRRRIK